jgi:APA family basic amino acid/polyamine antiporter
MDIFRKRSIDATLKLSTAEEKRSLKRSLGWLDIAVLGVSMSVGAGIFSVGAKVITQQAGPAAIISFIIAAIVCFLAAMCYAEFASRIPVTGSAYTYSYSVFGEIIAWLVGLSLFLELFMACSVITKYWGLYFITSFRLVGVEIPGPIVVGGVKIDWIILLGVFIFTLILINGAKLTSKFTSVFVAIKIAVILFVVIMGLQFFDINNFLPFIPEPQTGDATDLTLLSESLFTFLTGSVPYSFGILGIFTGAATIFFAFVGFDNAAAAAEETVNPKRNVPLGLLVGIGVVSLLYILVAFVTAGMVTVDQVKDFISQNPGYEPSLSTAFEIHGHKYIGAVASFGAFIGLTTVILVCMMALSRLLFSMSRDAMIPRWLSVTGKKSVPARLQVIIGVAVFICATLVPIDNLAEMVNIGTLVAFILVSFGVIKLRKDLGEETDETQFKVPFFPVLPIISGVTCIVLTLFLAVETWLVYLVFMAFGVVFYLLYGYKHSRIRTGSAILEE